MLGKARAAFLASSTYVGVVMPHLLLYCDGFQWQLNEVDVAFGDSKPLLVLIYAYFQVVELELSTLVVGSSTLWKSNDVQRPFAAVIT